MPIYPNFVFKDDQLTHTKTRDLHHPTSFGNPALTDVLTIHLEDKTAQLLLTLQYTIFADSAAIVRSATLTNSRGSTSDDSTHAEWRFELAARTV